MAITVSLCPLEKSDDFWSNDRGSTLGNGLVEAFVSCHNPAVYTTPFSFPLFNNGMNEAL